MKVVADVPAFELPAALYATTTVLAAVAPAGAATLVALARATAFGTAAVLGAAAKLATSLLPDGTIEEVQPGAVLEIGSIDGADGGDGGDLGAIAAELAVEE